MIGFQVLGVTQVSDSYPNVKYKLAALERLLGDDYVEYVVPLDKTDSSRGFFSALGSSRLILAWRIIAGHTKVFFYSLRRRAKSVYVCYPGIFVAIWLGLPFMRRRYPVMYLDAFISLYDTIVCDRRLLSEGNIFAKLLYRLEKRAFKSATLVIVDTPENALYYSELFGIPQERFRAIPLCIPPLRSARAKADDKLAKRIRCVFVGTFVPLQGVRTIVDAAKILSDDPEIEIVFVGDGQDASYLQDYLKDSSATNVTWHRGHFPTEFVMKQINEADICLGIFGDGPKAQRVLPYKIYYYLALGMPTITAQTTVTERVLTESRSIDAHSPLLLVPPGNATALAEALRRLRDDNVKLAGTGRAGTTYFATQLSDKAIDQSLRELVCEDAS